MTQEELEIKFDEVFEKNTHATGGGYEAEYTSQHGLWVGLLPIIMQFAKEYHIEQIESMKKSEKHSQ